MPSIPTATDERLAESIRELTKGLTDFRVEMADKLGKFQGSVDTDLKWIKRIGASVLLIAIGGSAWVIREVTTVNTEVKQQGDRLDKVERRLDGIDTKLDVLVRRSEGKAKGE
jgi:hypothetical protein